MPGGVIDGQKASAAVFNAAFAYSDFETTARGVSFTIVNNQSAAANVTGLLLDKTNYRAQKIEWMVYRKSTSTGAMIRVQVGTIYAWYDDTQWHLTQLGMSSVDCGVIFDIDPTSGQITYTSDNQTGTYSAGTSYVKYQIVHTVGL